jgi:hypothetical protein
MGARAGWRVESCENPAILARSCLGAGPRLGWGAVRWCSAWLSAAAAPWLTTTGRRREEAVTPASRRAGLAPRRQAASVEAAAAEATPAAWRFPKVACSSPTRSTPGALPKICRRPSSSVIRSSLVLVQRAWVAFRSWITRRVAVVISSATARCACLLAPARKVTCAAATQMMGVPTASCAWSGNALASAALRCASWVCRTNAAGA